MKLVRVGGGFLSLDEFIELYAPAEVEKFSKIKPIDNKKSP